MVVGNSSGYNDRDNQVDSRTGISGSGLGLATAVTRTFYTEPKFNLKL
jgi:hypothetical protein